MTEKMNELKKFQRNMQTAALLLIVFLAISLAATFWMRPAGLVLFALSAAFYLFYFRKQGRKFKEDLKIAILTEGLRPFLKNISYTRQNGFDKNAFAKERFLPCEHPDHMLIRDTVHGTYQMMPVLLSDITTDAHSVVINGRGKAVDVIDHLSGVYFDMTLKKGIGTDLLIWSRTLLSEDTQNKYFPESEKSQEIAAVKDDYQLYLPINGDASLIPDAFIKAFLRLAEYTPGKAAVQVSQNHLRIFISDRFLYTLDLPGKVEITPQLLNLVTFPEISYILRVADTL